MYHEARNPILPRHPSSNQVAADMLIGGALQFGIAAALPPAYREPFQYITIGAEANDVVHNWRLGIGMKF